MAEEHIFGCITLGDWNGKRSKIEGISERKNIRKKEVRKGRKKRNESMER
jgi:hypothetical protein